mmetsp:Transcript_42140/g.98849  ORF Transcript_42140/g.98849 Transcript_42140/m.98849 type:complete len:173 (-) Transcript_42140:112-630(-)
MRALSEASGPIDARRQQQQQQLWEQPRPHVATKPQSQPQSQPQPLPPARKEGVISRSFRIFSRGPKTGFEAEAATTRTQPHAEERRFRDKSPWRRSPGPSSVTSRPPSASRKSVDEPDAFPLARHSGTTPSGLEQVAEEQGGGGGSFGKTAKSRGGLGTLWRPTRKSATTDD